MKKMLKTVLLVLCFVGSAGVSQAMAQTDTFMFVPGIKGSSTDANHREWIDVVSLTQTLEQGKRNPQCTLEVIKSLDKSGPLLWGAAVTGQVFVEIQIDVRAQGENPIVFYQIKLQNARVTSISTSGNGGYVERVTLGAGSVQLQFVPQGSDGNPQGAITSSFAC